ncbi:MAG: DNA repair exonuclease [Clostridia bacterium]|nr:DNA repair exonuclease [Clostridia bacterium]
MKIIHCADLHLDSKMESNLPQDKARERGNELCAAFLRMVDYAKENGVMVVMIAGDMFDTERVSTQTAGVVLDAVKGAEEIDFLYLRGNHDESKRAFFGRELPKNLKLFSEDWTYYTYDDVTIAGAEACEEEAYHALKLDEKSTNIVMLHGQVSTRSGEDLVCLPLLKGKNIDYLALGHLHSYAKEKLDDRGIYCYCGCLEGRGFDECGEKGFVMLKAEKGKVLSEFVPFAKRKLYDIAVDITGLVTVSEISAAMESAAEGVPKDSLVKFTLTGFYTPETQKDLRFLRRSVEEKFYFVKIKDESRLEIEKKTYENDISLKGEFVRKVLSADLDAEEKDKIIMCGIKALTGEEVTL